MKFAISKHNGRGCMQAAYERGRSALRASTPCLWRRRPRNASSCRAYKYAVNERVNSRRTLQMVFFIFGHDSTVNCEMKPCPCSADQRVGCRRLERCNIYGLTHTERRRRLWFCTAAAIAIKQHAMMPHPRFQRPKSPCSPEIGYEWS